MKDILTDKTFKDAIKLLKTNNSYSPLVWIDNKYFYLSEKAKIVEFDSTKEEIDNAMEDGYIKSAKGVRLYLSKFIEAKPLYK